MSKPRSSPRKFAEKIALLNKKEAEGNAEFEKIIKEVEETTRAPAPPVAPQLLQQQHQQQQQQHQSLQHQQTGSPLVWYPSRSSSSSSWLDANSTGQRTSGPSSPVYDEYNQQPQSLDYIPVQQNGFQQQHQYNSTIHHSHEQPQQHLHHHIQQVNLNTAPPSPQSQLSPQHQQLNDPISQPNSISIIDTPAGVPEIAIFPIEDDYNYSQQQQQQQQHQQQVMHHRIPSSQGTPNPTGYQNDCSIQPATNLSPARSLPDISNLRVSSGASTPQCLNAVPIPLSDSNGVGGQHRLSSVDIPATEYSDYDSYDANTASLLNTSSSTSASYQNQNYCQQTIDQHLHQQHNNSNNNQLNPTLARSPQHGHHQHDEQMQDSWEMTNYDLHSTTGGNTLLHQDQSNNASQQTLHQNYYQGGQRQPQQYHQGQMVRANSTNAGLSSWQRSDTLRAPKMNNNLSKSSEVYNSYLDNYWPSDNTSGGYVTSSNHLAPSNPIMRSNSYNNLQDVIQIPTDNENQLNSLPDQHQAFYESPQHDCGP